MANKGSEHRKLAAMLFTDVVDNSALALATPTMKERIKRLLVIASVALLLPGIGGRLLPEVSGGLGATRSRPVAG